MRGQSARKPRRSQALFGGALSSLFVAVRHPVIAHERRPDAQKDLKRERNVVPVISIQSFGTSWIVTCPPSPTSIPFPCVKSRTYPTVKRIDREDALVIDLIEHELVPRFFDALEAAVKRIAPALIIRLKQKRLRLAAAAAAILSPDKRVRPVRVGAERPIIYERRRGAVLVRIRLQLFRAP